MFDGITVSDIVKSTIAVLWTAVLAMLSWNWNKLDKRIDLIDNKTDANHLVNSSISKDIDEIKKDVTKVETRHETLNEASIRNLKEINESFHSFRNRSIEIFVAKDEYFRNQAKTDKILADLPKQLAQENRQLLEDLGLIKK